MKFSIRDLLLVTVIVALALGWWLDHRRIASLERERNEAKEDAEWLADGWNVPYMNVEVARHTENILKKYSVGGGSPFPPASLPKASAPAPNPPKK